MMGRKRKQVDVGVQVTPVKEDFYGCISLPVNDLGFYTVDEIYDFLGAVKDHGGQEVVATTRELCSYVPARPVFGVQHDDENEG